MLADLYNQGYSIPDIAEQVSKPISTIYDNLKKIPNFQFRSHSDRSRQYVINENFFNNIDTEEKAYFLGFLYADGNIDDNGSITLSQAEQDKDIVYRWANLIGHNLHIITYQDPRPNRQLTFIACIRSALMSADLLRYGCGPRKTFVLKYPHFLNDDLHRHFIRGYFDGDGCISISKYGRKGRGKNNKNKVITIIDKHDFNITSTLEFVTALKDIFRETLNVYSNISKRHKDRDNNNYTLRIGGRLQIEKVMSWFYDGASIFLERKYNKFLQLKNESSPHGEDD